MYYIYIYICIHAYVRTYVCICTCMHVHICISVHTCVCHSVHIQTCIFGVRIVTALIEAYSVLLLLLAKRASVAHPRNWVLSFQNDWLGSRREEWTPHWAIWGQSVLIGTCIHANFDCQMSAHRKASTAYVTECYWHSCPLQQDSFASLWLLQIFIQSLAGGHVYTSPTLLDGSPEPCNLAIIPRPNLEFMLAQRVQL